MVEIALVQFRLTPEGGRVLALQAGGDLADLLASERCSSL
jgi:hypothetical protein